MNKEEFNNFIRFSDQKDYIENQLYKEEWITVYQFKKIERNKYRNIISFYPCLVSENRKRADNSEVSSWIMPMDLGRPGIMEYDEPLNLIDKIKQKLFRKLLCNFKASNLLWTDEQLEKRNKITFKIKRFILNQLVFLFNYKTTRIIKYQRFSKEGIEPLIHIRNFDKYPSYIEISEEFRHYFNLYEDRNQNSLLSSDDSGNSIEVVKIFNLDENDEKVQIKKKYLNEFLFVKKMWLCIQFQQGRFFQKKINEPINEEFQSEDKNLIYCVKSGENHHEESFTRFRGRKFFKYKPLAVLHYEQEENYEEFSFINENGDEKSFTCEEDKLDNFYGKNKDSPNYLTPISFKKEVLKKYYDKPEQYSVCDGYLKCIGCWNMEIDVQDSRVVVFLGDLSKLPYEEQKYWRSYNVIEKARISSVNRERSFEAKFTETDRPDFFFKKRYNEFNKKWNKKYNWFFFKTLSKKDKPSFDSLRIPLDEGQQEFDTQIQNLTKIFIESINIKEFKKKFPEEYKEESKVIDTLEQYLTAKNIRLTSMIEFLRKLQKLRNKGSAHIETDKEYIKALNYFKQFEGIKNPVSKNEVFSEILIRCIWIINFLESYFLNDKDNK